MAQQTKPDVNDVWASAGDVGTPPTQFEINQGWVVEKPPFQKMNWIKNLFAKFIKHVNEYGIPVWDANTNYALNAIVHYQGSHYTSNIGDNTGNLPTGPNWLQVDFQPAMPVGSIIDWYGDYTNPPQGWAVCDGLNGTPDLRGRVTLGADSQTGGTYPNNSLGGQTSYISTSSGSHTHTILGAGGHSHAVTVNGHSLSVSEMPAHNHNINTRTYGNLSGAFDVNRVGQGSDGATYVRDQVIDSAGGGQPHSHTASSGTVGNHVHTAQSVGTHNHTVTVMQPYRAVVKIMKV